MRVVLKKSSEVSNTISEKEMGALLEAEKENLHNIKKQKEDGSVILYGTEKETYIPSEAIEKYILSRKNIKAFSDDKDYDKKVEIYTTPEDVRKIISFGGSEYLLDSFLEKHKDNNLGKLCIDLSGRNHDDKSVWVSQEDMENIISNYIYLFITDHEKEKEITDTIKGELKIKHTAIIKANLSYEEDPSIDGNVVNLNGEESIAQGITKAPCRILLDKDQSVRGFILDTGEFIAATGDDDFETIGEKTPINEKIVSLLEESDSELKTISLTKTI